ncbi:MAG: porin [Gammaproteobacteria bacterium]|jgi:predicted porin
MKTKVLPTLIGVILTGYMSVAVADVTTFGHIDTSIDSIDQDGGSDDINMNCTTCSIGFKGSEELGNGLKAIFKLDFQYDTTTVNKDGSLTDRDQWLGLAGNFGQVTFGTMSTSYKSHGAMIDPIYRTAQQARDRGLQSTLHRDAGEEGQGRADNTVRYDSPSWNGLKVAAHYTLDSDETDGEDDDPYGGGISYENGPLLAYADYITSDVGGDDSAWKLGGKYGLGMFSFFAQYEKDDGLISALGDNQTVAGTGDGADVWMIGATATLGNTMAMFSYGQGDDGSGGSTASSYDAWELVAAHNMSKRTMIYAGFSEIDCDDPDNDVCSRVGSSGGEDDKFSLGMKHRF